MNREICSFYNLTGLPFTKEIDTDNLQKLPSVETSLKKLKLLVETRGIGTLTGKSGAGKSCMIRLLQSELNTGLYKILYICHSSIAILGFYCHLCNSLGLETGIRRDIMFRAIKDRILTLNKSNRIHPVLILDEAHLLGNDILRDIRLLTNFEIDSYNALTVLLCGQENLNQKFGLSILEPLANSISISVSINSLPKEESFSYIEQRVTSKGGTANLFTKGALNLIHQASGGVMRNINTIANSALIKAFLSKNSQVETEHVQSVIER
jgi:type II secretory pathway predicted ATPase ExeA